LKTTLLVPFAQIARVPLYTANIAADYTFNHGWDLRYTRCTVSAGNTKSLPACDYSDFSAAYPVGNGVIIATVLNLFNQWASIAGLLAFRPVPAPLKCFDSARCARGVEISR
jgi:hypothetical protein